MLIINIVCALIGAFTAYRTQAQYNTYDELLNMIEEHNDGDKVRMTVYRADDRGNYKKVEIEAELGFSVTSH